MSDTGLISAFHLPIRVSTAKDFVVWMVSIKLQSLNKIRSTGLHIKHHVPNTELF